jgi:Reverse transcriptase (RNA-dependent DNA polymerase)
MKNRTLRVAIENTLSERKQIENGVVQGAVLSVTLFSVAMAEITHCIEEPIKIIGYADDWIIHTTHKHERVSVVKLQKAKDKIVNWADGTGFQISIEKTKTIMFSRINSAIASRSRLDIWIKGTKIEKVREQKNLGLIFDSRMNWNEHILSTKAKAEKMNIIKCLAHTILSSLKNEEEAYGSASKAVLKSSTQTNNRGIRLA